MIRDSGYFFGLPYRIKSLFDNKNETAESQRRNTVVD